MTHVFRRFAFCTAGALGLLAICPSTALASNFGGLVEYAIALLAAMAGGALLLAVATEAILARVYRRKWVWILIPLFAVGWFAVIFGGFQWWLVTVHFKTGHSRACSEPAGLIDAWSSDLL